MELAIIIAGLAIGGGLCVLASSFDDIDTRFSDFNDQVERLVDARLPPDEDIPEDRADDVVETLVEVLAYLPPEDVMPNINLREAVRDAKRFLAEELGRDVEYDIARVRGMDCK